MNNHIPVQFFAHFAYDIAIGAQISFLFRYALRDWKLRSGTPSGIAARAVS